MSEKPEALRLAENMWADWFTQPTPENLREAAAELRRLHAECEALRADARRYQWLRNRMLVRDVEEAALYTDCEDQEGVDDAIDAAMEQTK